MEIKEEVRELKRKGLKQGEHFIVRRGKIWMFDIPRSKMETANKLKWEGLPVEEIAEIIGEDVEALKRWFRR